MEECKEIHIAVDCPRGIALLEKHLPDSTIFGGLSQTTN
jgi:hypothetical protein